VGLTSGIVVCGCGWWVVGCFLDLDPFCLV
jgi:hypothetical protein